MTHSIHSDMRQAIGKIRLATMRLARRYPFHCNLIERFKLVCKPSVGSMGVTAAGNELVLLYNAAFVLKTPLAELTGVLLHEVHHVVFGHVLVDPADYEDAWARTVAEEVTVNEFVKEPLPAGAITLARFPALPPMESTDQRYRRLSRIRRRLAIGSPGLVGDGEDCQSDPTHSSASDASPVKPGLLQTVDDHTVWGEARKDPESAKRAIRSALQGALLETGTSSVPEAMLAGLAALGIGTDTGSEQAILALDREGHLDWRRLLRQYLGQALQRRRTLGRPPRRFPGMAGIVPATARRSRKPDILAVVDTSGSISDELLEEIGAELHRLSKCYTVTVAECDADIQAVYKYRRLKKVSGRGGTDLRPPFESGFLRARRAELVVYFTDGEGPAPERPPRVPVVWCLVPGGIAPATWGRVIRMKP